MVVSQPLKDFTARLDYQDARVELDKGVVRIIIRDKVVYFKVKT
jgi:hypothetical protein